MALKQKSNAEIILAVLGGILTVLLVILLLLPFLNRLCFVSVATGNTAEITSVPVMDEPEPVSATVYYVMEENSKKISRVYVEVFHSEAKKVF